jgi:AraC family transcriptional regulator
MSARALDDWELVWLVRGRATLTAEPGFELRAGDLVVLLPGHRHGFDWNPQGETEHGYVHFDLADVTEGLSADEYDVLDNAATATGGRPVRMSMTRDDPLSGLCTYLLWLGATEPAGWQPALTRTVRHVLLHVFSQPHPPDLPDALPAPVQLAVAHLRGAWSSPPLARVSVSELAAAAHVSSVHLGRLFIAVFGLGVAQAQERLRCLHATTMLERTDLTVSQVAQRCGFSDLSHFSHRFKDVTGRSPSAAREAPGVVDLRHHPGVRRLEHLVLSSDVS